MASEDLAVLILDSNAQRRRHLTQLLGKAESPGPVRAVAALANSDRPGAHEVLVLGLDRADEDSLAWVDRIRSQASLSPLVIVLEDSGLDRACQMVEAGAVDSLCLEGLEPDEFWRALVLAHRRNQRRLGLVQSEERYRSIVEAQTELICRCRPDGSITFANQSYCRYFGQDADVVLGQPFLAHAFEDDRRLLMEQLGMMDAENHTSRAEVRVSTPWDDKRWLSFVIHGIFDDDGTLNTYQIVGLDITERKVVDEALQVAESNLRHLFVSNADGMVVVDTDGEVLFVNPAAEELLGQRGYDMMGRTCPFEVTPGPPQEVTFDQDTENPKVVEMRVVETKWQRQSALFASLRDITELVNLREKLRSMSLVDDLTGLYNRRGFKTLGHQQIKTANRMMRRMLMVFSDLDGLKEINDTLGHNEGDRAIREAALVLKATFRESDIISRFGGDEFVALAMMAHSEAVESIIDRVRLNADDWNQDASRPYTLSLSLGWAVYDPAQPRTLEDIISEADEKMYQEKRTRRGGRDKAGVVRQPTGADA